MHYYNQVPLRRCVQLNKHGFKDKGESRNSREDLLSSPKVVLLMVNALYMYYLQ